ncbi:MAG: hypothetical protein J0M37_12325 [Ignavibacteria bacterium]|nr:hypothetical protein [Ignavibacteria bacterium]
MTDLLNEIKKMNKLLALLITKDQEPIKSITQLTSAGYTQSETADILNTTKKAVEMALYRNKKKTKKKK